MEQSYDECPLVLVIDLGHGELMGSVAGLDMERMSAELRRHTVPSFDPEALQLRYVKRTERGPVLALLVAPARDERPPVRLTARWVGPEKAARALAKLTEKGNAAHGSDMHSPDAYSPFLKSAFYSCELGLMFTLFPLDRRLRALPSVLSVTEMARRFGVEPSRLSLEVGSFKPERKCLVRYTVKHDSGEETFFGKTVKPSAYDGRNGPLPQLVNALAGECTPATFRLPTVLGFEDDLQMDLFSEVSGTMVSELLVSELLVSELPKDGVERIAQLGLTVGEALRSFHDLPVDLGVKDEDPVRSQLLKDNAAQLAAQVPAHAATINRLVEQIDQARPKPGSAKRSVTHGDFNGDNVLVDSTHAVPAALVDFEDCAMGEPADDIGCFLAHCTDLGLQNPAVADVLSHCRQQFLVGYGIQSAQARDSRIEERIVTSAATHCVLRAYQSTRRPEAPGTRRVTSLLHAAEQWLREGLPA